ncbi:MAG: hypothetical protein AB8B51_21450 [Sedimentitalea sp.]
MAPPYGVHFWDNFTSIDPIQAHFVAKYAASLVGRMTGNVGAPFYSQVRTLTPEPLAGESATLGEGMAG